MISMKLSIIIPMYSVEKYVERCILSTQQQDLDEKYYEVIVVNDGSPDSSLRIAEDVASKYNNIKVISRTNGGLSAARNTGIENSIGEYLFFLDSDDWIEENSLRRIVEKLDEEQPDVLCINLCKTNGVSKWGESSFKDTIPMSGPKALRRGLNPMAQLSIVCRKYLDDNKFRFYEGIYHEDSELTPRMHYMASKISFLDGLVYNYYVNEQSIMGRPNPKKSHDLINVVCPNLSDFCNKMVKDEDKYIFHNMISMYINNALYFILKCDKSEQEKFAPAFANAKELFVHLNKSTIRKYKLEGILFSMLPSKSLSIYKMLLKIK